MYFKRTITIIAIMQIFTGILMAQNTDIPFIANVQLSGNETAFNSSLLPIRQLFGLPQPFYSYLRESGGNKFNFEGQSYTQNPNSGKGFNFFCSHFNKKFKKLPFESQASIIFDLQKPCANLSQGNFKPSKSPLFGGYCVQLSNLGKGNTKDNNLSVGTSISACVPFRNYFQCEFFVSIIKNPERWVGQMQPIDSIIDYVPSKGYTLLYELTKVTTFDIVPLKISYKIADLISVGAGSFISFNAFASKSTRQVIYLIESKSRIPFMSEKKGKNISEWFKGGEVALFIDAQISKVRRGPAFGMRYLRCFKEPQNHLFIYASWSFRKHSNALM